MAIDDGGVAEKADGGVRSVGGGVICEAEPVVWYAAAGAGGSGGPLTDRVDDANTPAP